MSIHLPNFFSKGVINCGRTSSDRAKCLPSKLVSGTRFGFTSSGSKYNHCDFTEKLLEIESSSRKGSTYSERKQVEDVDTHVYTQKDFEV